eukprot:gene36846-45457_t
MRSAAPSVASSESPSSVKPSTSQRCVIAAQWVNRNGAVPLADADGLHFISTQGARVEHPWRRDLDWMCMCREAAAAACVDCGLKDFATSLKFGENCHRSHPCETCAYSEWMRECAVSKDCEYRVRAPVSDASAAPTALCLLQPQSPLPTSQTSSVATSASPSIKSSAVSSFNGASATAQIDTLLLKFLFIDWTSKIATEYVHAPRDSCSNNCGVVEVEQQSSSRPSRPSNQASVHPLVSQPGRSSVRARDGAPQDVRVQREDECVFLCRTIAAQSEILVVSQSVTPAVKPSEKRRECAVRKDSRHSVTVTETCWRLVIRNPAPSSVSPSDPSRASPSVELSAVQPQ